MNGKMDQMVNLYILKLILLSKIKMYLQMYKLNRKNNEIKAKLKMETHKNNVSSKLINLHLVSFMFLYLHLFILYLV